MEGRGPTLRPPCFPVHLHGPDRAGTRARPFGLGDAPDIHALSERVKTVDERQDKGWALPREDTAKRDTGPLAAAAGMIGLAVTVPVFPIRPPV